MPIVNEDNLNFIFTSYGLARMAEAIRSKSVNLNLSKIKFGDADGSYYVPTEDQTELKNLIENGSFYILGKDLLEDGVTVSFNTTIPETFGGCDIREVGLYETVNGVDYLFAIGTQQPLVKPEAETRHFIVVDYFIFLRSANLASAYDQIVLNPDNMLITDQDLQDLMSTMLFTQSNLSYQIGENTRIIGLDRESELFEYIGKLNENYGYTSTCESYASLLGYLESEDIFSYWVFDYPKRNKIEGAITDIGINGYNLSLNRNVNAFSRSYEGLTPFLNISGTDYYYTNPEIDLKLVDEKTQKDKSFSMLFSVSPNSINQTRTLLAKSNYATKTHAFEVLELDSGALQVNLFADESNMLIFTSDENLFEKDKAHTVAISYNGDKGQLRMYLDGSPVNVEKTVKGNYSHMSSTSFKLYGFTYTPYEAIYTINSSEPERMYTRDCKEYTGTDWTLNGRPEYKGVPSVYNEEKNLETPKLYAWKYDDGVATIKYVYTRVGKVEADTVLYNSDYTENKDEFAVIPSGEDNYIIEYQPAKEPALRSEVDDIEPTTLYAWTVNLAEERIWADNSEHPTKLFTVTGEVSTDTRWTISEDSVFFNGNKATYDSRLNTTRSLVEMVSYIVNRFGEKENFVNSKVGLIAIILKELSDAEARAVTLEISAGTGKNPCFSRY